MKKTLSRIKQDIIAAGLSAAVTLTSTLSAFSTSGAFASAENATKELQNQIVALAKVLFPFSLVILIVAILFTHDQKALQFELKTALIICVAYIALLIVTSSSFLDTFSNLGIG